MPIFRDGLIHSWKTYFSVVVAASLGIPLIYGLLIYFFWGCLGQYRLIEDCLVTKENAARRIGGSPKIVFSGGSATHYGVIAKNVQEQLGVPSVNLGMHAGLEIDYILYRTKKILRRGDIVILPLEYEHFLYNGESSTLKTSFVLGWDRDFLSALPWRKKFQYVCSHIDLNELLKAVRRWQSAPQEQITSICVENENGDGPYELASAVIQARHPVPIQRGRFKETYGLAQISEFSRWCNGRGVSVYVSYANTVYFNEYDSKEYREYFANLQRYFSENDIRVIGSPYDFFFPNEMFMDTGYHLDRAGATSRTSRLVQMMRAMQIVPKRVNGVSN